MWRGRDSVEHSREICLNMPPVASFSRTPPVACLALLFSILHRRAWTSFGPGENFSPLFITDHARIRVFLHRSSLQWNGKPSRHGDAERNVCSMRKTPPTRVTKPTSRHIQPRISVSSTRRLIAGTTKFVSTLERQRDHTRIAARLPWQAFL